MTRSARTAAVVALAALGASCASIQVASPLTAPVQAGPAPAWPLEIAWERNVEGAMGPGAPLVAGTRLTTGTRRGDIVIVDLEDGRLEGSSSFGDSVEGGVALAPGGRRLYVPLATGRRSVVAYDLVAGQRLWGAELGSPVQTRPALVDDSRVVVASMEGTLAGLEAASGQVSWTRRPDTTAAFYADPLEVSGGVIAADDRGRVERVDALDGSVRWTTSVGEPVYNRLAAAGDAVVVPTTRGSLTALDAATGRSRWTVALGDRVRVGAPLVAGDVVIAGTSAGEVVAVDLATGTERWRARVEGVVSARPAAGRDVVYVGTQASRLVALDLTTGDVVWETTLRGRVKTDLTVAGDLLIVAAEPRHIIALKTETARAPS